MNRKINALAGFVILLLGACDGNNGGDEKGGISPPPPAPQPVSTAIGTPVGTAATATIGSGGGTLTSADGQFSVDIPAGALSSDVNIGIQPITNFAPGQLGAAYRLTPEGITFAVPVTLIFKYTDDEVVASAPEALGSAFQTQNGQWRWVDNSVIDTTAKTVSIPTNHFSDWSKVEGFQIRPPSASVKVKNSVTLQVRYCYPAVEWVDDIALYGLGFECDTSEEEVAPLVPSTAISEPMVNGIAGGNASVGTVTLNDNGGIEYHAPASKPEPNTVAVSARISYSPQGNKTLIVASVQIKDDGSDGNGTIEYELIRRGINQKGTIEVAWTKDSSRTDTLQTIYSGTGTIAYHIEYDDCVAKDYTFALRPISDLHVFTVDHPLSETYLFTMVPEMGYLDTFQCGAPDYKDSVQKLVQPEFFSAGICLDSALMGVYEPIAYTDPKLLSGNYTCSYSTNTNKVTWNFTMQ